MAVNKEEAKAAYKPTVLPKAAVIFETEFDAIIKKPLSDADLAFTQANTKPEEKKELPPKPIPTVNKAAARKIFETVFNKLEKDLDVKRKSISKFVEKIRLI